MLLDKDTSGTLILGLLKLNLCLVYWAALLVVQENPYLVGIWILAFNSLHSGLQNYLDISEITQSPHSSPSDTMSGQELYWERRAKRMRPHSELNSKTNQLHFTPLSLSFLANESMLCIQTLPSLYPSLWILNLSKVESPVSDPCFKWDNVWQVLGH